jgi:hypothetical protein
MALYQPTRLTYRQRLALAHYLPAEDLCLDSLATPGQRGPVVAEAEDGRQWLIAEDGSFRVHEPEVAA